MSVPHNLQFVKLVICVLNRRKIGDGCKFAILFFRMENNSI